MFQPLIGSLATGAVSSNSNYVGGLVGIGYHDNITATFATGTVNGVRFVGGLVGDVNSGSNITASFSAGAVSGNLDVGGFVGFSDKVTYLDNHYAIDSSGQSFAIGTIFGAGNVGAATEVSAAKLTELQCPVSQTNLTYSSILLYDNWSSYLDNGFSYWDFGLGTQLPGLNQSGMVFRDADADGVLD
jgi:hypothetical protein